MEPDRPWDPCTKGLTVEQHLGQLRFPLTRSYYHARRTQLASCGIPLAEITSNSQLQYLLYVQKMMNATATAWNASDQRYAALLPPMPDDNTVFSAIHLASMAQTEGCLIASSLNQEVRWSLYESAWQDMLLSFAEDRSVCCIEDPYPGPSSRSGPSQQHLSCFGRFIWGEAYAWPPGKLFMQYRVFEAQLSWQARYALSIPATPTTPTFYKSIQQNAAYPVSGSASSPVENRFDFTAGPGMSSHVQRPGLSPLSHQCAGVHCRTASTPYESDTTASSSSSDASVLATPNAEANFSLWDAVSPSVCEAGASISPYPVYDSSSPTSASKACITTQCGSFAQSHSTTTGRGISDDNNLDDNGVGNSPRPLLRRRTAVKESPKRIIQNREKSKRYYYRRKAQRDAFNVFLDSLSTVMSTSPQWSESQLQAQSSGPDCLASPFTDGGATPDADNLAYIDTVSEQTSEDASTGAGRQTATTLLSWMASSNSASAVPRTRADLGSLQALLTGQTTLPPNWQDLLAAEMRNAPSSTTPIAPEHADTIAALIRLLQGNATKGASIC